MHALMKVENLVVPFSFPYVELRKERPGFIARENAAQVRLIDIGTRAPQPSLPLVQENALEKPRRIATEHEPLFE